MVGTKAIGAAIAVAAALAGCAGTKPAATAPSTAVASSTSVGKDSVTRTDVVTATAVVEDIDLPDRLVTLRGPDGGVTTLRVDESVRNLPQVRKGDQVVTRYYQSMVVKVKKPGTATPGVSGAGDVLRAAAGEKPGGAVARTATVVATVVEIDRRDPALRLRGPEGNVVRVAVRDPANLEKVKVGDLLEITYTEAVAIDVQPAAKQ